MKGTEALENIKAVLNLAVQKGGIIGNMESVGVIINSINVINEIVINYDQTKDKSTDDANR